MLAFKVVREAQELAYVGGWGLLIGFPLISFALPIRVL